MNTACISFNVIAFHTLAWGKGDSWEAMSVLAYMYYVGHITIIWIIEGQCILHTSLYPRTRVVYIAINPRQLSRYQNSASNLYRSVNMTDLESDSWTANYHVTKNLQGLGFWVTGLSEKSAKWTMHSLCVHGSPTCTSICCILSNHPDFRGTVPIIGSKFTAVPLLLYFVLLFKQCSCVLLGLLTW